MADERRPSGPAQVPAREYDPLSAEFAALRTAVLVRPPGVRAAQVTLRQRRHRTAVLLTSVIAFVVAAAGVAFAGIHPSHPEVPATQPPVTHRPSPSGNGQATIAPSATAIAAPPPGAPSPGAHGSSGPTCHQYGAVLLDNPTASTVTVRADKNLYPLCPGERVRVFVAVYSYDAKNVQHLYYSKTAYLDAAHNPLTLLYQTPPCRDMVYVMSGNATIKQTIPAMTDPSSQGPQVYGSSAWGPYNGVIWIEDQTRCADPTST
jgi:hypothetical protein